MGKHYVPRHYLKGFCEHENKKYIWAYEKTGAPPFRTNIINVAQETNYYPDDVEKYLSDDIEGPCVPILDRIRSGAMPSHDERKVLARYMAAMINRVPRHRQRIEALKPKVIKKVFSAMRSQLEKRLAEDPSRLPIFEKRTKELEERRRDLERELPSEVRDQVEKPVPRPKIVAALSTMTWVVFRVVGSSMLITSDNPVFFFEHIGIGQKESEISFPISSSLFLWATWSADFADGFAEDRQFFVREINRRTASAATRYVYYHEQSDWVQRLASKDHHRLNQVL